ncbi:MAG: hypothetical protein FD167_1283, partial [bacterium]
AGICDELGVVHLTLRRFDQALEYQEKALVISREIKDLETEAIALINMATSHNMLNQESEAIKCCQQALAVTQQLEDLALKATALHNLADILNQIERYDEAIPYAEDALNILEQMNSENVTVLRELLTKLRYKQNPLSQEKEKDSKRNFEHDKTKNENIISSKDNKHSKYTIAKLELNKKVQKQEPNQRDDNGTVLFRLEITNDSTKVVLDHIELRQVQGETEERVFTNEHQLVPWKIRTTHKPDGVGDFSFTIAFEGMKVEHVLKATQFRSVAAKGGKLKLQHIESGIIWAEATSLKASSNNGVFPNNEEKFIGFLENLIFIQNKTSTPIIFPQRNVSSEDMLKSYSIVEKIKFGIVKKNNKTLSFTLPKETIVNILANCNSDGKLNSGSFLRSAEEEYEELLDTKILMGHTITFCGQAYVLNLDALKKVVQVLNINEPAEVCLQVIGNEEIQIQYLKWVN